MTTKSTLNPAQQLQIIIMFLSVYRWERVCVFCIPDLICVCDSVTNDGHIFPAHFQVCEKLHYMFI